MTFSTIHPFPARMAPDIAREFINDCPEGGRVLDPMCGSGTVLRAAVEAGLDCTGVDIDPLSVLMSRVWVTPLLTSRLIATAEDLVHRALTLTEDQVEPVADPETRRFIEFWFAPQQRGQLLRLATVLRSQRQSEFDALRIALSRIIVSKEMRASLARDTSHSRPHRVATENDFDVFTGFIRAAAQVARRLAPDLIRGRAEIFEGDARKLNGFGDDTFDLAVTSPPYLNAIDYLRGHRLTLVWLGYDLASVRLARSASVGVERVMAPTVNQVDIENYIFESASSSIKDRHLGWIRRFAVDMQAVFAELARVVKKQGVVVMVVANSFLGGAVVNNAMLIEDIAKQSGFLLEDSTVRSIPARRRYLPPPRNGNNTLDSRMRKETVLKFRLEVNPQG